MFKMANLHIMDVFSFAICEAFNVNCKKLSSLLHKSYSLLCIICDHYIANINKHS